MSMHIEARRVHMWSHLQQEPKKTNLNQTTEIRGTLPKSQERRLLSLCHGCEHLIVLQRRVLRSPARALLKGARAQREPIQKPTMRRQAPSAKTSSPGFFCWTRLADDHIELRGMQASARLCFPSCHIGRVSPD